MTQLSVPTHLPYSGNADSFNQGRHLRDKRYVCAVELAQLGSNVPLPLCNLGCVTYITSVPRFLWLQNAVTILSHSILVKVKRLSAYKAPRTVPGTQEVLCEYLSAVTIINVHLTSTS